MNTLPCPPAPLLRIHVPCEITNSELSFWISIIITILWKKQPFLIHLGILLLSLTTIATLPSYWYTITLSPPTLTPPLWKMKSKIQSESHSFFNSLYSFSSIFNSINTAITRYLLLLPFYELTMYYYYKLDVLA